MENWFIPYQTSELPPAQKVLILAPHPDDEVFGCGGAAALLQQRGAAIDVVVLTDGAGFSADEQRQAITQTRQAETNAALAVLGLHPAQFWGIPDRSLVYDEAWTQRIASQLQGVDLVFAPSLSEVHPDHAATGRAVLAGVQSLIKRGERAPDILFYEVGIPLAPNFLLDITSVWGQKKRAMQSFASQQAAQDYARHIEGLNTFRTYTLDAQVTHAEAYWWLAAEDANGEAQELHARMPGVAADLLIKAEAEFEKMQAHWLEQQAVWKKETQRINEEKVAKIQLFEQQVRELQTQAHEQELRYKKDVSVLQSDMRNAQSTIHALQSNLTSLQAIHQSMLDSRSWRWTKPLRWLSRALRSSNQD